MLGLSKMVVLDVTSMPTPSLQSHTMKALYSF